MIPQEQRVVDDKQGDCFGACVASILEVKDWPNFHTNENGHMRDQWNRWLEGYGLELIYYQFGSYPVPRGLAILTVQSTHFPGNQHAVVWDGSKETDGDLGACVVWNPSPYRAEGIGDWLGFDVFALRNPARAHNSRSAA